MSMPSLGGLEGKLLNGYREEIAPLTISGTIRTMTDEDRLMSIPSQASKRRAAFLMIASLVALIIIICCIAFAPSMLHRNNALTHREYTFARALVNQEIRQQGTILSSATVTVSYGKVLNSNVGYSCISGELLNIKLIGDFPHITVSPFAPQPRTAPQDSTVHAVDLTADAKTGRLCLIGIQTGKVVPARNAISLPFN